MSIVFIFFTIVLNIIKEIIKKIFLFFFLIQIMKVLLSYKIVFNYAYLCSLFWWNKNLYNELQID